MVPMVVEQQQQTDRQRWDYLRVEIKSSNQTEHEKKTKTKNINKQTTHFVRRLYFYPISNTAKATIVDHHLFFIIQNDPKVV